MGSGGQHIAPDLETVNEIIKAYFAKSNLSSLFGFQRISRRLNPPHKDRALLGGEEPSQELTFFLEEGKD